MQTLIVHDRDWRGLLRDLGWPAFIGLHVYVGSMIFSAPLHAPRSCCRSSRHS